MKNPLNIVLFNQLILDRQTDIRVNVEYDTSINSNKAMISLSLMFFYTDLHSFVSHNIFPVTL